MSDIVTAIEAHAAISAAFDDIATTDGFCDWADVANARDEALRLLVAFSSSRAAVIAIADEALTLANARIAKLEIELAATELAITHPHGETGVGDQVEKCIGYKWPGEVRSVFTNRAGEVRFVVECTAEAVNGALHIFNGSQLCRAALKGDA